MTIHFYEDVSNLNAPYDVVPLQGLGQTPQQEDPAYPWRQKSQNTLELQRDLNEGLTSIGACLLLEDGKLGPRVCGALSYFGQDHLVSTCPMNRANEPYIMPKLPCPPEESTPVAEEDVIDLDEVPDATPSWALGAVVGVAAIGLAWYLTRKKR